MDYNLEPNFGFARQRQQATVPMSPIAQQQMPQQQFKTKEMYQGLPQQLQTTPTNGLQLKVIGPREWQVAMSTTGGDHQAALAQLQYHGYDVPSFMSQFQR